MTGVVTAAAILSLAAGASAQGPELKNIEKSIQVCNRVGEVSPDLRILGCTALIKSGAASQRPLALAIAYNNRGNAFMAKGEYDQAIDDYNQAIKANPTYARAFNNRGLAYQKKSELNRAIEDFDRSIKLYPISAPVFVNRAEAHRTKNDYRLALRDYDEAIRLQPNLEGVWNGRCWIRAIVGELRAALSDCNEALRAKPNAAAFDSRGLTYLKLGQLNEALADYNSALKLEPRLASSLYGRGVVNLRRGNTADGNADVAAATAIDASIQSDFARYGVK